MKLVIPEALLLRAVDALRDGARYQQAVSQHPDLIRAEDTQAWADAKAIEQAIRNAKITAKVKGKM